MAGGTMSGSGTVGDPYLVEDATDLKAIESYGYANYYKQANDFTLGTFEPIGYIAGASYTAFTGQYDGNNKTITNGTINYGSNSYTGIFAYVTGTVKDLIVTYVDIIGYYYTGIIGSINSGATVSNVWLDSNSSVSGYIASGGIVGYMQNTSDFVEKCLNEATIYASSGSAGGIVGWQKSGNIDNCHNKGAISCDGNNAGGIVGSTGQDTGGRVYYCLNEGAVSGVRYCGGIAGVCGTYTDVEYNYALNTSVTRSSGSYTDFGRITGDAVGGTQTNNYALDTMTMNT